MILEQQSICSCRKQQPAPYAFLPREQLAPNAKCEEEIMEDDATIFSECHSRVLDVFDFLEDGGDATTEGSSFCDGSSILSSEVSSLRIDYHFETAYDFETVFYDANYHLDQEGLNEIDGHNPSGRSGICIKTDSLPQREDRTLPRDALADFASIEHGGISDREYEVNGDFLNSNKRAPFKNVWENPPQSPLGLVIKITWIRSQSRSEFDRSAIETIRSL